MKKSELNIWGHHDACPWNHLSNWPRNIRLFFRKIKWSYQRITRGYSNADVWNLDSYLLYLLRDSLHHLAETTQSYPQEFVEQSPSQDLDEGFNSWRDTLEQMSSLFNLSMEDSYSNPFFEEFDNIDFQTFLEARDEGKEDPVTKAIMDNYLKCERDNYTEQVKCRTKAFQLLDKYFNNLWD